MWYELSYDVAAVVILLCVLAIHGLNHNKLLQNRTFSLMSVTAMLAGIFDIMDVYGSAHIAMFPMAYHQITSYGYFLMLNSAPCAYAFYTVSLKKNSMALFTKRERLSLYGPIVFLWLFVLTNMFHHGVFYYDAAGNYHRGDFQAVLYAVSLYYMIFGVVYTLCFMRKNLTKLHLASVYLFVIVGFGGALLQMIVAHLYVSVFAIAVCILLTLLAIQKPDEGIDAKVGIFNYVTFTQVFQLRITGKDAGMLFLLYIEDIAILNQAIGVAKVDGYLEKIGKYFSNFLHNQTFYLGGSVFAILQDGIDEKRNREFVELVHNRFEEAWVHEGSELYMNCRLLQLKVPEEVQSIEAVQAYKDYLKEVNNRSEWFLQAKDTSISMTKRKMEVEAAIKRAITDDNFEIYYQPIYSTQSGKITSAEALLRLIDPEIGFVPPDEFIVMAEKDGSILKVGEIVFEKVCRFIRDNNLLELGIEYIEVNLSVIQCLQESLAESLIDTMSRYNIHSSRINLEITETAANSSPKMLIRNMDRLFKHGVSFSLDDFGSGYSNMGAIMELPLDMIKFDKSMIDMLSVSSKGNIVFLSSVAMIKQMNMKIVAEGIETEDQKKLMEDTGIEYLQGYYFSRPIPELEFLQYVKEFNR